MGIVHSFDMRGENLFVYSYRYKWVLKTIKIYKIIYNYSNYHGLEKH